MINPKYDRGDQVIFNDNKIGIVVVVNASGSMLNPNEPVYDILDNDKTTLFKEIKESEIKRKVIK